MRRAILGGILAFVPCALAAAPPAAARSTLSLNGAWHVIVDPYDNGYLDYRSRPYDLADPPTGGYALDRKPKDKTELVEYDFDTSPTLMVPGDWNSQDDRLLYYEGTLWYRRLFDYPAPAPGRRVFLRFGAANYQADVYLNGRKLGRHVGGFTPFAFEVTDRLRAGAELAGGARRQPAAPRGRADAQHGLVELRRAHARRRARGGAGDVRGPTRAPPGRRLARPHRRAGRRRREDASRSRARRDRGAGGVPGARGRTGRCLRRGSPRAAARALDARAPAALRGRPRGGRRSGHRPGRLPHDRHARGRDPAERPARLPARDLDPRGEPDARRARLLARGRAPPARLGARSSAATSCASRTTRTASTWRAWPTSSASGVGGDPGLLDDRLGERGHAAERAEPADRDDRARREPGQRDRVVGRERDAGQRAAHALPGGARRPARARSTPRASCPPRWR